MVFKNTFLSIFKRTFCKYWFFWPIYLDFDSITLPSIIANECIGDSSPCHVASRPYAMLKIVSVHSFFKQISRPFDDHHSPQQSGSWKVWQWIYACCAPCRLYRYKICLKTVPDDNYTRTESNTKSITWLRLYTRACNIASTQRSRLHKVVSADAAFVNCLLWIND